MIDFDKCAEFAAAIRAAGWSIERRVETGLAAAAWESRRYSANDAALAFVASFDGISIRYPRTFPPGTTGADTCILDAAHATGSVFESTVRSYEVRVSEKLCPIGVAASGHLVLLMGPSGRVYGGYDSYLGLYGERGYEAICHIFNRVKGIPIA